VRSTRELNRVGWQAMQHYPSLGSAVYAIYSALLWKELILLYSFQWNGDVVPVLNTFRAFLTSSPSGSEWSASRSGGFTPGEKSSVHIAQHAAWPPQTSWTPQQRENFLPHPGIEQRSPVRSLFIILTEGFFFGFLNAITITTACSDARNTSRSTMVFTGVN